MESVLSLVKRTPTVQRGVSGKAWVEGQITGRVEERGGQGNGGLSICVLKQLHTMTEVI